MENAHEKPFATRYVSALEYEALINLDKMIRMAMSIPGTGEFLVGAIQALDKVRTEQGIVIPEAVQPLCDHPTGASAVSDLANGLIKRAMAGGSAP